MLKKDITLKDMPVFVEELQALLKKPQVLLLEGPLGAGKTTLVRFLLESNALALYSAGAEAGTKVTEVGTGVTEVGAGGATEVGTGATEVGAGATEVGAGATEVGAGEPVKARQKTKIQVSSPAFAIQHIYPSPYGEIYHIDLYRLKNDIDLESTGFWDIFSEPETKPLIIIEWANRLHSDCFPLGWNYVKLIFFFGKKENTRDIKVELFKPCNFSQPVS